MAEILITGVEMPVGNKALLVDSAGTITKLNLWKGTREATDPFSVKARDLPPHGRLGDLDALAEHIRNVYCKNCKRSKVMCKACEYGDMIDEIDDAPTVLEASK